MKNIVEVNLISKQYTGFLLDSVSMKIQAGTIMGLIGENGAGKSTLINIMLDIVRPDGGDIQIFGQPYHLPSVKEDIGFVIDENMFPQTLNVKQIAKICSGIYENWEEDCFAAYQSRYKLPEKKLLKEFSKGMRMKLNLACALSHGAKLLILDEATVGLDPVVRSDILDTLSDFVADGERAVLISSHITSDLERAADFVTYIHEGTIYLSGGKDEILETYGKLVCTPEELELIASELLMGVRRGKYQCEALVKNRAELQRRYSGVLIEPVTLEDIMVFIARGEEA